MIKNLFESKSVGCKGRIFKADVNHFTTKRGLGFSVRLNEMKRMSCKGCEYCCWLDDCFSEINGDWPIIDIELAENDKLYYIDMCNVSKDWETGCVDGYDLKLVPYESQE